MNDLWFERFLNNIRLPNGRTLTASAIQTRIRWAHEDERILGTTLDDIVADDQRMRDALLRLRQIPGERSHAPRQNALRKYYRMVRGREFPRLSQVK